MIEFIRKNGFLERVEIVCGAIGEFGVTSVTSVTKLINTYIYIILL